MTKTIQLEVEPCGCNEGRGCGQFIYCLRDDESSIIDGGGEYKTEDAALAAGELHRQELLAK